jgi:peptidoglycan/LPS O-acetylase OafA/YrhL
LPVAAWSAGLGVYWVVSTQAGLPRAPLFEATVTQILLRQWLYGAFALFLLLPAIFGPQDRGLVRTLLKSRPVAAVGVISYGVYLWHESWRTEVLRWMHLRESASIAVFGELTLTVAALSLAVSAVSYFVVERPAQRLGLPHDANADRAALAPTAA